MERRKTSTLILALLLTGAFLMLIPNAVIGKGQGDHLHKHGDCADGQVLVSQDGKWVCGDVSNGQPGLAGYEIVSDFVESEWVFTDMCDPASDPECWEGEEARAFLATGQVLCPAGKVVTGGGFNMPYWASNLQWSNQSQPFLDGLSGRYGWLVTIVGQWGESELGAPDPWFEVYAICVDGP